MKYLLVGKCGVLDTMVIGLGFLGLGDINSCSEFGDVEREKRGKIMKAGADAEGNEVWVVGNLHPDIIEKADNQLYELSGRNVNNRPLRLIKVSAPGETLNLYLLRLARLPLLRWLADLARQMTLQRQDKLILMGRNLRIEHVAGLQPEKRDIIAAKPM